MIVHFWGPFESLAGREARIDLQDPMNVQGLIGLLASRYSGMARYSGIGTDADLSAHLVFVRNGMLLRLSDSVEDGDVLQVLLPSPGG